MYATPFQDLLASNPGPEALVQQGLRLLEADFRQRALLALADWAQADLPYAAWAPLAPDLFTAIAALQRPSWGNWNGLLTALRRARAALLKKGDPDLRRRIEGAAQLAGVLRRLEQPVEPAVARGLLPLGRLLRTSLPAAPGLGQILALAISLRNRVAHDLPADPDWWKQTAQALRPLLGLHARPQPEGPAVPEPWLLREGDQLWTFNGLEKDFTPLYVSPLGAARHEARRGPALLLAFQRLLGATGVEDRDFKALLERLAPEDVKGVLFGDYLLGRAVGEGGFATVHVGRQLSTGRKVALKVLRDGLGEEQRRRFQQEAAFLARLDHPGIVRVLGRGEEAWSPPRQVSLSGEEWYQRFARSAPVKTYMALEWVDGETLEAVYRRGRRETRVLVDWFAQAAEALAAVHAEGLIHRDLKPSNLMVTVEGRVKLMDFGIARADDEARTRHTSAGSLLGTPVYMAPEQFQGEAAGAAADVYALCATFYELFTGVRLYGHDTASLDAVRTSKLEGRRPEAPRSRVPDVPWEIETLLLGGLEREVKDRPVSAVELAADLRRVQANEPIRYRRPPLFRRAQLFYRRHRVPVVVGSVATVALLVLVGVAGAVIGGQRSQTEREKERADLAERERQKEEESTAGKTKVREEKLRRQRIEQYFVDMQEAPALFAAAKVDRLLALLERYEKLSGADDPRGFEWYYWWRVCHAEQRTLAAPDGPCRSIAFDATGKLLAGVSQRGLVTVWNVADGSERYRLRRRGGCLAFSPDRTLLATTDAGGGIRLWEVTKGKEVRALGEGLTLECLAFSADGKLLAAGDATASLWVWDLGADPKGGQRRTLGPAPAVGGKRRPILAVAFSPNAETLASAGEDGTVHTWNVAKGKIVSSLAGQSGPVTSIAFSPDGHWVLSGSIGIPKNRDNAQRPGEISVRDARSGEASFPPLKRAGPAAGAKDGIRAADFRVTYTADGRYLVGTMERSVQVWEARTGRLLNEMKGHTGPLLSTAVSPAGRLLASAGADGTIKIWDAQVRQEATVLYPYDYGVVGVAVSPDGSRVAVASEGPGHRPSGPFPNSPRGPMVRIKDLFRFYVRQFDTRTGRELARLGPDDVYKGYLAYSADGKLVSDGHYAWEAETGKPRFIPKNFSSAPVTDLRPFLDSSARIAADGTRIGITAFSPDGKTLAVGGGRVVRLWDPAQRVLKAELRGHGNEVTGITFSPDGRRLVSTSGHIFGEKALPGEVKLWEVPSGRECLSFNGGGGYLFGGAAFSPDGRRLYIAATRLPAEPGLMSSGHVFVLHTDQTRRAASSELKTKPVPAKDQPAVIDGERLALGMVAVQYSPQGDRLAVSTQDQGKVGIVDATNGKALTWLEEEQGFVYTLRFSPGGTRVARLRPRPTRAGRDAVMIWDVASGKEVKPNNQFAGSAVHDAAFSADGDQLVVVTGDDLRVSILNLRSGPAAGGFPLAGLSRFLKKAAFSPGAKYLACLNSTRKAGPRVEYNPPELTLWDAQIGRRLHTITGLTRQARTLQFSADGSLLVAAFESPDPQNHAIEAIKAWDVATGRQAVSLDQVTGIEFPFALSPDGRHFAAAAAETFGIQIVDLASGKPLRTVPGTASRVLGLAYRADGKQLASADSAVHLWDLTRDDYSGRKPTPRKRPVPTETVATASVGDVVVIDPHFTAGQRIVFSSDGLHLAADSQRPGICVWDLRARREILKVPSLTRTVSFVFSDKLFHSITTGRGDKPGFVPQLDRWDLATGKTVRPATRLSPEFMEAYFSPDGKRLALRHDTRARRRPAIPSIRIEVWETGGDRPLVEFPSGNPARIALGQDGKLLAQAVFPDLNVWDLQTRQRLFVKFRFPPKGVAQLQVMAFSADDRRLVTVHSEAGGSFATDQTGIVKVWSVPDGKELHTSKITFPRYQAGFGSFRGLALSPDGEFVAAGAGKNVIVWETRTGKRVRNLKLTLDDIVIALGYSADGRQLAVGTNLRMLVWKEDRP
jgi:WD40 repeat protein/serine/threonine protein kinase